MPARGWTPEPAGSGRIATCGESQPSMARLYQSAVPKQSRMPLPGTGTGIR